MIGTVFSVVLLYLTAYPLSVKSLPGRKWISIFFIITMYFGGGLVPAYLVVKHTGLVNSMWAMFLPGGVGVGNVIIMRNFFENNIPKEMIEAAEIDGASKWTTFLKIVVPLSRSIMAVMVVFSMVAYWNDWFTALIYILPNQERGVVNPDTSQTSFSILSGMSALSKGYETNEILNQLQKDAGVNIEWTCMSDSLAEQVNIRIAGGGLPDAFMGVGFSNYDISRYGDEGTFIDLTPYLTEALAPDTDYDRDGCFSGSALELPDGRHLLMYTGVKKETQPNGETREVMLPKDFEYHNGNGTLCLIGTYDEETDTFTEEQDQAIDYGIDFYAPQTILAPDGRRIMIGWMQNWDTCNLHTAAQPWFGQMSLPRELSVKDGRLIQKPVRELKNLQGQEVKYENVTFTDLLRLDGVRGRKIDMELSVRPGDEQDIYKKFAVRFAQSDSCQTAISFRPYESILKVDRKFSGSRRAIIHQRRSRVNSENGRIRLRIILDNFSVEVFVNDGEQVLSATMYTDVSAEGISFFADGMVTMDVVKYGLHR